MITTPVKTQRLTQKPLFQNREFYPVDVATQGIKYIGSKKEILPRIITILQLLQQQTDVNSVLDGFSGSTRVSQALAKNGFTVIANDTAIYSKVCAECYLLTRQQKQYYDAKIEKLNALQGEIGWFSERYGGVDNHGVSIGQDGKKKMWQLHNTKKLDAMLEHIHQENNLQDKNVLLTSLMLALDKVDSSLGHQVSYLKKWSQRSYNTLFLKTPDFIINNKNHQVHNKDIFELIKDIKPDVAYYDPPYCSNNDKMPASRVRYSSYYHLWTSICLNDAPEVFGACNRRKDTSDKVATSVFESFKKDDKTGEYITSIKIKELIQNTNAKCVILSYSSSGRTNKKSLQKILNALNYNFLFYEFDYKKNIMHSLQSTNEWTNHHKNKEYLIIIDKTHALNLEKLEQQFLAMSS